MTNVNSDQVDLLPLSVFQPAPRRVNVIFADAKRRPPILEEMQPDIDGLAHKLAVKYTDQSCVQLHYDELVADCAFKLAKVIHRGDLERLPNRFEFFKYIKTVFNNHVRSQVGRWRLTRKRGGQSRTADGEETHVSVHTPKNSDVHADDPDQHLQLSDPASGWRDAAAFIEDIKCYLTPLELLVLREFDSPSSRTLIYAELDSSIGRKAGEQPFLKIEFKHYAAGLDIPLDAFKATLNQLGSKLKQIRMNEQSPETQVEYNLALSRLEEIFEVQIPENLEQPVVRRLLTLAAVDQYGKVAANPQVKADLQTVGAKVPEPKANRGLSCFGILYQRHSRACGVCQLNKACMAEAANFGLDKIALSPTLLGARSERTPIIVAERAEELACLSSPRDEEVFNFLRSNLEMLLSEGEILFRHKDTGQMAVAVEIGTSFKMRFMRPSAAVKAELIRVGSNYYLPDGVTAAEAAALINAHLHQMFATAA